MNIETENHDLIGSCIMKYVYDVVPNIIFLIL